MTVSNRLCCTRHRLSRVPHVGPLATEYLHLGLLPVKRKEGVDIILFAAEMEWNLDHLLLNALVILNVLATMQATRSSVYTPVDLSAHKCRSVGPCIIMFIHQLDQSRQRTTDR